MRDRVWATIFAAVAVACSGALFGLSRNTTAGVVFSVFAIACISVLWWQSKGSAAQSRADRPAEARGDAQAVADAVDAILDGRTPDTSGLDAGPAQAIARMTDRFKMLSSEIAEMSPSDELTSLAKEEVFNNVLWREFSRAARYKTAMSVALVEIAGFQEFSTRHGRGAAEEITRHVASVILQMIRETDLAARYGENTFAVIMPETGRQGAGEFAQRLDKALRESEFKANGGPVPLGVLVGVASVPSDDVKTAPDLVERAASALSSAGGRVG